MIMVAAKISKIALLSLGCVSLASACFGVGLDNVHAVDNVSSKGVAKVIINGVSTLQDYEGTVVVDDTMTEPVKFEIGKTYYLSYAWADVDTNGDVTSYTQFNFAQFTDTYGTSYMNNDLLSYASFTSYSPSANYFYVRERGTMGFFPYCFDDTYTTNLSMVSYTYNLKTSSLPSYLETYLSVSSSGPYYLYLDPAKIIEYLTPFVSSLAVYNGFKDGYNAGYAAGYGDSDTGGYHDGYDAGYNAGMVAESNPVSTLSGLFAVIMDFPITILNGFSGFVVWNTPVMTILISFAVMGLVLWVVKRFIK